MKHRILHLALSLQMGIGILLLVGCGSASKPVLATDDAGSEAAAVDDENQRVAEAALGKQAEIVARGDLARNGSVQLLVVNRVGSAPQTRTGLEDSDILITRAVVLEKSKGKWAEILRCDEYLKNPRGYLGGLSAGRAAGWLLKFSTESKLGLEMKFTPAGGDNYNGKEEAGTGDPVNRTVVVAWNARAKRYQSLDPSHQGYLSEAPSLETPYSILK